jgi:hypothetical protein
LFPKAAPFEGRHFIGDAFQDCDEPLDEPIFEEIGFIVNVPQLFNEFINRYGWVFIHSYFNCFLPNSFPLFFKLHTPLKI